MQITHSVRSGFWCVSGALAGLLFVCVLVANPALAQKTDILTFTNGDHFTGDIKELDRGLLRLTTNSAGTIYIEWLDIKTIESTKHYTVETASGVKAFGSLASSEDGQDVIVSYQGREVRLKHSAVVEITRVKDTFWSRIDGSLSFGFSYKKANDDLQLNFAATSTYQTQRDAFTASLSALVSSQNQSEGSERYTGSFGHQANFRPKWYSLQGLQLEQNTELDLQLRAVLSAGAAYRFFNTARSQFETAAGLAVNDENYFTIGKADRTSLEMFATVGYDFFKFNTPKADITTRYSVYPSLTERGRVRTQMDADVTWEIIRDLNWAITFYWSTDNQPPEGETAGGTEQASGTDYGVTTNLKWTF